MALQEDEEEARPQSSQILPVPAAAAAASRRRCSPLAEKEGSQTVVLVVNPMVQQARPMLLSACQARSRESPPLP